MEVLLMKKLLPLLVMFILLLVPGTAFAKDWPAQTNVPVDKVWTVKFNQEIDPSSINNYSAYVTDNLGRHFVYYEPSLGEDKQSIIVKNSWSLLHSYANYNLHVSRTIRSVDGKSLNEPVDLKFSTGPREGTKTFIGTVCFEEKSIETGVLKTLTIDIENGTTEKFEVGYFTTVDGDFDSELLNKSFKGKIIYFAVDQPHPLYTTPNAIQAIFTQKP